MKKGISLLLTIAFFVSCFVACSQPGASSGNDSMTKPPLTENTGSEKKKELVMWTFLNPENTSAREVALKEIIANFEKANTTLKIVTEPISFDQIPAKFFASHVAQNGPDIIWMSFREMGEAVRLGTLEDLNTLFINSWSQEEKDDLAGGFWEYAADETKRYQMTFVRSADMLVYREDVFKEKGINIPIKSWDDFIKACKEVTNDLDGDDVIDIWGFGQQFGIEKPIGNIFVPSLIELQGNMFGPTGEPDWSTDAGIKSMQLAVDMVTKYKITPPTSVSYSQEDLIQGFAAGKYAVITAAASRLPAIRDMVTFDPNDVKLAHFPSWSGDTYGSGILSGWGVGVWSGSKNKIEAGKFLEHIFNKESEKIWVLTGKQVPLRKSTLESMSDYFNIPENDFLTTMVEEFTEYGWACPWKFPITAYDTAQNKAAQDILINGKDVKQALIDSEQEFKRKSQ